MFNKILKTLSFYQCNTIWDELSKFQSLVRVNFFRDVLIIFIFSESLEKVSYRTLGCFLKYQNFLKSYTPNVHPEIKSKIG